MLFRDLKPATKDIDIVLTSPEDLKEFFGALKAVGYKETITLPREYEKLGASFILRNPDGFQTDLFHRQICGGLVISESMERRAQFMGALGNLDLYLMAPEDIFLFKGITEREADLDDMRTLAIQGLDWETIKNECALQERRRNWESFLANKLWDLKNRYGIEALIIKDLMKAADYQLVKMIFTEIIQEDKHTFKAIANAIKEKYRYSPSWTRKELNKLVEKGAIKRKRMEKAYYHFIAGDHENIEVEG